MTEKTADIPPNYSVHRIARNGVVLTYGWTREKLGPSLTPSEALARLPASQRSNSREQAIADAWADCRSRLTPTERLGNLADGLAASILEASDDEIMDEVREDGADPTIAAEQVRSAMLRAVRRAQQV